MLHGDIQEDLDVWFAGPDFDAEVDIRNSRFLSFAASRLASILTSLKIYILAVLA